MTKTRAHSDIPRGSNAHEDLGACVLCILFSTPSLLIRRRNGPPHTLCISDGTFAHPDVDVCLFYFLEVFVNIEEN